jgi:hypothetical protein
MAYTAQKLITNAWYLSGIIARNLQTVSSDQINDGLDLLNAFLSVETADKRMIPYFQKYETTAVAGQELYFVPNLIQLETITFFIGNIRFSLEDYSRDRYFGESRVVNIQSLPYQFHAERVMGGMNVYLYFLPNSAYPIEIFGKFSLNSVTLNQDLSLTLDQFYIEYIRYCLANKMCEEYNIEFQPQAAAKLKMYQQIIKDISPLDLTMQKVSSFNMANSGDIFLDSNIALGWRP